jgi:hypothetical protein
MNVIKTDMVRETNSSFSGSQAVGREILGARRGAIARCPRTHMCPRHKLDMEPVLMFNLPSLQPDLLRNIISHLIKRLSVISM